MLLWGQPTGRLRESRMRKKINVLLSSDCMWYMCGCCWLKVVVVIAGLKMPGGGCVPLIPYLISRSRGEALNPKHTHTLTLLQTHICTCTHIPPQSTETHMHTHTHTFSCVILHTKFWNSQEKCSLLCKGLNNALYITHTSMATHVHHALTHKHV